MKTILLWIPDVKNEISSRAPASCDTGQRGVTGTNHAGQPNMQDLSHFIILKIEKIKIWFGLKYNQKCVIY